MSVSGIGGIGGVRGIDGQEPARTSGGGQGGQFGQMLQALGSASGEADRAMADLAVGGERDLHDVVLSVEMESLAFDLAVQIRNRLLEAYSEIFRMQV
jgi:flagellar hook-basal body complex protein FliE